jgi:pimeloyl-ACP methyl ester carboxylesterase
LAIKHITIHKDGEDRELEISYEIYNHDASKDMIVLHGWGSHKELMSGMMSSMAPNYRHIYIDMPGFGKSPNEKYILYTEAYAQIISHFLDTIGAKRDVIVGHSFGGKVATLLNPDKLILMSSSGIVIPKAPMVKFKIGLFKALKGIGFGELYSLFASKDANKMSRNMYETFKNVVDEDFSSAYQAYQNEALLLWGRDDTATPLTSGITIASLINNSRLESIDGDHYFFLQNPKKVKEHIEEFLSE